MITLTKPFIKEYIFAGQLSLNILTITFCEASDICNGLNLQDGLIIIITRLYHPHVFWVGIVITLTKPFIKEYIFAGQLSLNILTITSHFTTVGEQ